jgi:hypothetical protein
MAVFCHAPPTVAVTHAPEAELSVAKNNITGKRVQGHAKRIRNKRGRIAVMMDSRVDLPTQPRPEGVGLHRWGLSEPTVFRLKKKDENHLHC